MKYFISGVFMLIVLTGCSSDETKIKHESLNELITIAEDLPTVENIEEVHIYIADYYDPYPVPTGSYKRVKSLVIPGEEFEYQRLIKLAEENNDVKYLVEIEGRIIGNLPSHYESTHESSYNGRRNKYTDGINKEYLRQAELLVSIAEDSLEIEDFNKAKVRVNDMPNIDGVDSFKTRIQTLEIVYQTMRMLQNKENNK